MNGIAETEARSVVFCRVEMSECVGIVDRVVFETDNGAIIACVVMGTDCSGVVDCG